MKTRQVKIMISMNNFQISNFIRKLYLDNIANGVIFRLDISIAAIIPGASFWIIFFVASGVTSLLENPVPPIVRITSTSLLSLHEIRCSYTYKNIHIHISSYEILY